MFPALDSGIVALYIVSILAVAYWKSRGLNTISGQRASEFYFLGNRSLPWYAVGASLFSSDIGPGDYIGLTGAAFTTGFATAHNQWWGGSLILVLLAYIFVPVYITSKISNTAEYIEHRYNRWCGIYLVCISLFIYFFQAIPAALFATAFLVHSLTHLNVYFATFALMFITGLYVAGGGLKAVTYTETLQTVFILGSGIPIMIFVYKQVSFAQLRNDFRSDDNLKDLFHLYKPLSDEKYPWPAALMLPLSVSFYWIGDQTLVQRVISAKDESHAKTGAILCGIIKIIPVFMFIVPGMFLRVAKFCNDECLHDVSKDPNNAIFKLAEQMPEGVIGIIVVGILSALMSSLAAMYNSSSTLLALYLFKHVAPQAGAGSRVVAGKVGAMVMVLLSIAVIPLENKAGGVYLDLQRFYNYFIPPLSSLFLFGVLWPRANQYGAMASIATGFIMGLVFEVSFLTDRGWQPGYGHAGLGIFIGSSLILFIVSLSTSPPNHEKIQDYTWNWRILSENGIASVLRDWIHNSHRPRFSTENSSNDPTELSSVKDDEKKSVLIHFESIASSSRDLQFPLLQFRRDEIVSKWRQTRMVLTDILGVGLVVTMVVLLGVFWK